MVFVIFVVKKIIPLSLAPIALLVHPIALLVQLMPLSVRPIALSVFPMSLSVSRKRDIGKRERGCRKFSMGG